MSPLEFLRSNPTLWEALKLILSAVITFVLVSLLLRFESKVSKRLIGKRNNINLRFVENIVRFVVIFLAVQWVVMSSPITQSFGRVLFQGTAIIGAIAGFAAQPVIADMICGLILSATKPFNIGDRIELEDGTAGIVQDITLRHVTLLVIDTVVCVIPNSKLNNMKITNMSRGAGLCSMHMRFNVSYDTEIEKAMAVIGRAVRESPHTVPDRRDGEDAEYGPVYFIEYADSSLVMATTVYFPPTVTTEVVKSDINLRVKRALDENGFEIPYNYVNVVMSDAAKSAR